MARSQPDHGAARHGRGTGLQATTHGGPDAGRADPPGGRRAAAHARLWPGSTAGRPLRHVPCTADWRGCVAGTRVETGGTREM